MSQTDAHSPGNRLFHGVKFNVDRLRIIAHDGNEVVREVVVHPGAVVILPVTEAGKILLIRNQRFAVGRQLLELPAGTLEEDEEPAACAARELAEETGYRAAELKPLTAFYATPGICTERMHAFAATGLEHVGQQLEQTEYIEVEPMALGDVLAKIERGEIEDAKTIATILYYARFVHPDT